MMEAPHAPLPPPPRPRLHLAASAAAGLARKYALLVLAGAVGWACGYGFLGVELKLSAIPPPWNKFPAAWLLPFQKGTLTFVAEAVQGFALPKGRKLQWAIRASTGAWLATLLWQWQQLDHGEGILLYGALVALLQFTPSGLRQRAPGLRSLGWLLLWLPARLVAWSVALLLTARLSQELGPLASWAVGGAVSGLLLALFLHLGPKEPAPLVFPQPLVPYLPPSPSGSTPGATTGRTP